MPAPMPLLPLALPRHPKLLLFSHTPFTRPWSGHRDGERVERDWATVPRTIPDAGSPARAKL
jgi:hypothetical protein